MWRTLECFKIDIEWAEDMYNDADCGGVCYPSSDEDTSETTNCTRREATEQAEREDVYNDDEYLGLCNPCSDENIPGNSDGTKSSYTERAERKDKYNNEEYSGLCNLSSDENIPGNSDGTKSSYTERAEIKDKYNNEEYSGLCNLSSDENIPGNSDGTKSSYTERAEIKDKYNNEEYSGLCNLSSDENIPGNSDGTKSSYTERAERTDKCNNEEYSGLCNLSSDENIPGNSDGTKSSYTERAERTDKYNNEEYSGLCNLSSDENIPGNSDGTKSSYTERAERKDIYNIEEYSGLCNLSSDENIPGNSDGTKSSYTERTERKDKCNNEEYSGLCNLSSDEDNQETVDRISSVTERAKTGATCADDLYCSEDNSADKDFVPDSCDNSSTDSSDGEESDKYPMLLHAATTTVKNPKKSDKGHSDCESFNSSQKRITSETSFVSETSRKFDYVESDDDDDFSVMINEEEILRDKLKPDIFITRVLTSETTKSGKKKKSNRVYNSYQYCGSCKLKVSNLSQHFDRNQGIDHPHRSVPEIQAIKDETNDKERTRLQSLLRAKYNHEFNMRTISKGKGEILLERRPVSEFQLTDYGPCPNCLSWIAKKLLRKHQKACVAKKEIPQSIGDLTIQSECLSGQLKTEASKKLLKEVFAKMLSDEVAAVVKRDTLIVQLGNQWIEKNVGNVLKRGVYTSQILRLVGRFLITLKKITGLKDASLWDFLKPKYFQSLVKASLLTACPLMDDEDNLKSPSNAIKLGYDIRRLINGKIGMAIMEHDSESQHEGEQMLKLMDIYWGTQVTKLARVLLEERRYYADKTLPLPEDIASLNKYLCESIATLDYTCTSKANFRRVAELIQTKLVIYNRRRTGELQAIRLCDYARRCKGGDGVHLLGKCSDFEKKLLESQELMTIRGKVGRPVPVILPQETKRGLTYLTDTNIRYAAGVADTNEYIFASGECSIVWAYDSIKKTCASANLKAPSQITSTNMRKYMATITQVLDLTEHQMQWVLNHLGHTMNVHQIHYRATSDLLERTQISKLLILQDQDRVGEFKNKCLNDIQLEDVVFDEKAVPNEVSCSGITESDILESGVGLSSPDLVMEALDEAEVFFPNSDDQLNQKARKRPSQPVQKIYWSKEEEDEIYQLFKSFFDSKTRPKPCHCVKAIKKSKKNSGLIWKRKKDTLKKKVFRMIDKLTSYTEMGVLLDVLNIAKEKKYMALTHVQQDTTEHKSSIQLQAKKKGLTTAANLLISGADRLKRSQQEIGNRQQNEFHYELLKLRQNWRLKKVGNAIIGDLSYRSAGSRFWQGGTFEVTKNTTLPSEQPEGSVGSHSSLEVIIPSELEGSSYVQVEVKSVPDSMDLITATLRVPDGFGRYPSDAHWQTKLEAAQNVLFCKELFAQLAREAVQLKSSVPHVVVGSQIITNIFPSVQLSIVLCHSTGKGDKKSQMPPNKVEHNHVLEHSLHQLLREVHHKTLHLDAPHPVTATFGMSKRRRLAGPSGMSRSELKEMADSETLLEQIIKQARHEVLRARTMVTIDRLATSIADPQIMAHWSCLNSPLLSNVKVIITSNGYEGLRLTWQSFDLEIGTECIKVVTKDRRTLTLSFQEKEVEDLIRWQVSQHHILLSQNLARLMGWQILSYNGCSGVGEMEDFATASSVQLVAPNNDRMLSVRSGPTTGLHVYLKIDDKDNLDPSMAALVDPKWLNLSGTFKEVDMEQIDGRNLATKLELILAVVNKKR